MSLVEIHREELVTLSSHPLLKSPQISNAGRHLSTLEFHSSIQHANKESPENSPVLLDARNLYETRIGKFQTPNVETLDPQVKQYSDFSSWIDDNGEQLKDIVLVESGVKWHRPILGQKVLGLRMCFSYLVVYNTIFGVGVMGYIGNKLGREGTSYGRWRSSSSKGR